MDDTDSTPQYPIRIAARRTGLSAHVLRAWERRYGVVEPARSEGRERLYSNEDIFRLRLLRRLTDAGHPIGRLSTLDRDALVSLLREEGTDPVPLPDSEAIGGTGVDRYMGAALAALERMDGPALYGELMRAVVALPSTAFMERLVIPLLHQVGELWSDGRLCPAHEHLLSTQLSRVLGWLAGSIPIAPGSPNAVAVTSSGQRHEFGALMAAIVAAEEGWHVTYLGTDLPAGDIAVAVQTRRAALLLMSFVFGDDSESFLTELREVRRKIGWEVEIAVGGRSTPVIREEIAKAGATWIPDLRQLRAILREHHPAESA